MTHQEQELLTDLLDLEGGDMTEWEVGFIESMARRRRDPLTSNQERILRKIHRERMPDSFISQGD